MLSVCTLLAKARDKAMRSLGWSSPFSRGMISRVMSVCSQRAVLSCSRVATYSGAVPGTRLRVMMWEPREEKRDSTLALAVAIFETFSLEFSFENLVDLERVARLEKLRGTLVFAGFFSLWSVCEFERWLLLLLIVKEA